MSLSDDDDDNGNSDNETISQMNQTKNKIHYVGFIL